MYAKKKENFGKGGIELSDSVCLFFFPLNFLLVFFVNFIVVMVVLNFGELGFICIAENFHHFVYLFNWQKGTLFSRVVIYGLSLVFFA